MAEQQTSTDWLSFPKVLSGDGGYCYSEGSHLGEDERRVMLEVNMPGADGVNRGRAAAEGALAGLLRGGVHRLPATHARGQIRSCHPAVVPHVEVPTQRERDGTCRERGEIENVREGKDSKDVKKTSRVKKQKKDREKEKERQNHIRRSRLVIYDCISSNDCCFQNTFHKTHSIKSCLHQLSKCIRLLG